MQNRNGFRTPPKTQTAGSLQKKIDAALVIHKKGDLAAAKLVYEDVLRTSPKNFDALHFSGLIAYQTGNFVEAEDFLKRALRQNAGFAPLQFSYAMVLKALKRTDEAVTHFDKATALNANYVDAHFGRGDALKELGRLEAAIASFDKVIALKPAFPQAFNNRGVIFDELDRLEDALASFDQAIAIASDFADAFLNRGSTLQKMKRFDEALANYDQAVAINPFYAEAFKNRGAALQAMRRLDEALASYEKALSIQPDFENLYGTWLHTRLQTSEWSRLEDIFGYFRSQIEALKNVTPPFTVLGAIDDPQLQLTAAQQYVRHNFPANAAMASPIAKTSHAKIRIGYFSADFHNHATAYLMAELFELHDRDHFEVIAFSFGPDTGDAIRERLKTSFDQFIDVRSRSDREIAELSRSLEIDIAVDLKGFTQDRRTGIFAHRCAPVQVNYIGYPGTMGADYIDYIIADDTLIPAQNQRFYSEKVVYLPNSYQVNDTRRKIADTNYTRIELGLPQDGFVFCCFNNSYKILPSVFDSWMRILGAVEGSVLWLLDDNDVSTDNLKREAASRNISPDRLIFAKRMVIEDHLARHRCADLFLDTLPCNAHTTASDALWAGSPLLTCLGQSFAGRVAASLLHAVDLPELVTASLADYERLAIRLATHPDEMKALKRKLSDNRLSSKLFDTPLYAQHLEAAYAAMHGRHQAGLAPDHIHVAHPMRAASFS